MEREDWLSWYAERGLATTPLVPRGKRPLRAGWQKPSAEAWRSVPGDANVGVVCGQPSRGLVVLDFDTPEGPSEASGLRIEELAVHTLVARTARGWHVYAREEGARTRSPWPGLDVRAEGSMVVAPPSIHPSGARYVFVRPEAPIAHLGALPFLLTEETSPPEEAEEIDWEALDALVAGQAPKLQAHWALLKVPRGEFDRSRADFAVARCLWEGGYDVAVIAEVLSALPGSKARERGEGYARMTALKASRATGSPQRPRGR